MYTKGCRKEIVMVEVVVGFVAVLFFGLLSMITVALQKKGVKV